MFKRLWPLWLLFAAPALAQFPELIVTTPGSADTAPQGAAKINYNFDYLAGLAANSSIAAYTVLCNPTGGNAVPIACATIPASVLPFSGCQWVSATPVTQTGSTAEATLATCTLPANSIPAQAMVRITALWERSATTTDVSTYSVRFSSTSGAASGNIIMTATNAASGVTNFGDVTQFFQASTTSQLWAGTTVLNTSAVNTAATSYINFDCANTTSSADSCGIYAYIVEIVIP